MTSNLNQPNFFIVGCPKSGTSALSQYLSEHPNVFFSTPKEPFYWCQDFTASKSIHGVDSLESYLRFFSAAKPDVHLAIGEGSTTYLQSKVALQHIIQFNPQARVIVMLRNPVEVVQAMHNELLRHGFEEVEDFDAAWELQEQRALGNKIPGDCLFPHQLQYRDVVRYAEQIARLYSIVPESQRRIILFDDFKSDTARVYGEILEFLELPNDNRTEYPVVHGSKVIRNKWIKKLHQNPPPLIKPVIGAAKKWYYQNNGASKRLLQGLLTRGKKREPVSVKLHQRLTTELAGEIDETANLLKRDLSIWTRDETADRATSSI